MPPLVLTHTQRFKSSQPSARIALTISRRCRQSMQAKKVAPSTEWETIKSNASDEKPAERVFGKFSGGHRKFAVFPRAFAAHMALYPDVVGGIRENGGGFLSGEKRVIGARIQGVPAEEAVGAKDPQVAQAGYRRAFGGLKFVRGVRGFVRRLERLNPQIDLGRLEARRLDLEIERYVRKLLQNNRHFAIVPARAVRQLVVGEHVGFGLLLAQMLEADHRRFGEPEQLGRLSRPCPATTRFALSTRMGALKPNASMLRAIARICSRECFRGLPGSGTMDPRGK